MYTCSICKTEATVDHVNPASLNCDCDGGKVVAEINGHAYGQGSLNAHTALNNNLSEPSASFLKQMMSMIIGVEFFQEGKTEIFANEVVIEDSKTGRRFSFTLTAKEI